MKPIIITILILLVVLGAGQVYADTKMNHFFCQKSGGTPISIGIDGCSMNVIGIVDKNFLGFGDISTFFRDACNYHDMCYSTKGATKSRCDTEFHKRLLQKCHDNFYGNIVRHPHCKIVAESMRSAVREFGGESWSGWNANFRKNTCEKVYKSPY